MENLLLKSPATEGNVAVITGAASGIGSGLARKALARGMRVVLADIDAEALAAFSASLHGDRVAIATDVSDSDSVEALARHSYQHFGRVDLLFNNAGILKTGFSWTIAAEQWKRSFDINVHGVVNGLRAFVPRMIEAGEPAHIVNTSSIGGFLASPLMAPYSASKFAVTALTQCLHAEMQLLKLRIGVSLLAPGPVKTSVFADPFGERVAPAEKAFVDQMRSMLSANGLSADEFAELAFAGIDRRQFWLIPQPDDFDGAYRAHADQVLARLDPSSPWS